MSGKYWTKPWNPFAGCSKCSKGCENCYALDSARRMALNPNPKISGKYAPVLTPDGEWSGEVILDKAAMEAPLKARIPQVWFNSMCDPFHKEVADEWLDKLLAVIALCPNQFFVLCTKQALRMGEYFSGLGEAEGAWRFRQQIKSESNPLHKAALNFRKGVPLPNLALMTTCCTQAEADKNIPHLLACRPFAKHLGVSLEPLLGPIKMLEHLFPPPRGMVPFVEDAGWSGEFGPSLDFVILGGESGKDARPMEEEWAVSVQNQCKVARVGFYLKQWGARYSGMDSYPDPSALPWSHILEARRG